MNLLKIAKQVLKEDSWGNNPSAAGSMSPGKTPNATQPATSPDVKFYDVLKDYQGFENKIDSEEEQAKKELKVTLSQNLVNKKITARASKGAVGQVEKDYPIDVVGVEVTYMSDKFYIVLNGKDKKDYYINTAFKIKILGSVDKTSPTSSTSVQQTAPVPSANNPSNVQQPKLATSAARNVVPQH